MRNLAKATVQELQKGKRIVVVVSAMGKTTDTLIEHYLKACGNNKVPRDLDDVLSMGERTSARLFTAALRACGVTAKYFDPSDVNWPIITDEQFGNANVLIKECIPKIKRTILPLLERDIIPVIPGFIGKTLKGEITTLGRGGSDVTAFILARAIKADEVLLVTDVDGVMTADPKIVANPKIIKTIEATKLANICDSGAKFIHRRALKLLDGSFNVKMLSYNRGLNAEGTMITGGFPETPILLGYNSPVAMLAFVTEAHNHGWVLSEIFRISKSHNVKILAWCAQKDLIHVYLPDARVYEMAEIFHSHIIKNEHKILMSLKRNLALLKVASFESNDATKVLRKIISLLEEKGVNVAGVHFTVSNILIFVEWTEREALLSLSKHICDV